MNALIAETNEQRGAVIHAITHIDQVKTEAYKEFAERLKKHTRKMQSSDFSGEFWDKAVLVEDIDNLLKEMTGENIE